MRKRLRIKPDSNALVSVDNSSGVFYRPRLALTATLLFFGGCQSLPVHQDSASSQTTTAHTADAVDADTQAQAPAVVVKPKAIAKNGNSEQIALEIEADTAWDAIATSPGLNHALNRRIQAQKNWYLQHPAFLAEVLGRSKPFLGYVIAELDKRNMPRALALLPVVESRYDPNAISKAGAVGTWQFMPATAQYFDIKMNWWFDGRRDVIMSTDAALTYLDQLQERFNGDWLLALAAYNAGGGTVNKAIRRNDEAGRKTDYWNLGLPQETKYYVPRLLALLEIIQDAEKHNIVLPHIATRPEVSPVNVGSQIDVTQLAQLSGISEVEFRALNPGLKRWAIDPQGPYVVLVPADRALEFRTALLSLPKDQLISWHRHKVRPGETISHIASRYKIPTREFQEMNKLSSSFIRVGQSVLVPKGENVDIARKTSVQPLQTAQAGRSKASIVRTKNVDYKVQPGDTLWKISRQYNTSVQSIAADNQMPTRSPLRVGKTLKITVASAEPLASQRVNYQVKPGDSLYGIARQFKVSINEIADWNELDHKRYIKPGQKLTLFLSEES